MKLNQLRHLVAIAEAGSLRQAGRNLNMSQSALTKSVLALERELRATLIQRDSQGIALTQAGEALIRRAKLAEAELDSARSEVQSIEEARTGHLRISASPTVAINLLPRAVMALKAKRPQINVHIEEATYPDVLDCVRRGDVDVAICLTPERVEDDDLLFETLIKDAVVPAVRTDHPLTRVRKPTLADLRRHDWVVLGRSGSARTLFDHIFRQAGLAPPRNAVDCTSFICAMSLAEISDHIVLAPRQVFAGSRKKWSLVPLQLSTPMPAWTIGAITRIKSAPSPAGKYFLAEFRAAVRAQSPPPVRAAGQP